MKRKCENLVDLPWKRPKLPVLSVDRRVRATHAPIFNLTSRYVSGKDSGPLFTIPRLGYFRRFSISNFRRLLPSRTSSTSFLQQYHDMLAYSTDEIDFGRSKLKWRSESTRRFPPFEPLIRYANDASIVKSTSGYDLYVRSVGTRITRFPRRYKTTVASIFREKYALSNS